MSIRGELDAIRNDPEISAIDVDLGFRVGSYNVQRFDDSAVAVAYLMGEQFHTTQFDKAKHAQWIANYLTARYDIVLLQEAFKNYQLLTAMAGKGWTGFAEIETTTINIEEDSGLAFFSRFPFVSIPEVATTDSGDFSYDVTSGVVPDVLGADFTKPGAVSPVPTGARIVAGAGMRVPNSIVPCESTWLAFHEFETASGTDRYAGKGVALARVRHPTGFHITLVNTHMNTGGADGAREEQYQEINDFLASTLGEDTAKWGVAIMAGDFNTTGDHERDVVALQEWNGQLSPAAPTDLSATLLRRGFRDVWDQFAYPSEWRTDDPAVVPSDWTERTDPGDTTGVFQPAANRRRIDYLLVSAQPDVPIVPSHVRVSHDIVVPYGTNMGTALSDHFALGCDFGNDDDFCGSWRPRLVDVPAGSPVLLGSRNDSRVRLTHPSSAQWFMLLEPGAYAVAAHADVAGDTDLVVEVYRASDMSAPVNPVPEGSAEAPELGLDIDAKAVRYHWSSEPQLIKVTRSEGQASIREPVEYLLGIVCLDGLTPNTAIPVHPGDRATAKPAAGSPPTLAAAVWFWYDTLGPFNTQGRAQRLEFEAVATLPDGTEQSAALAVIRRTSPLPPQLLPHDAAKTEGGIPEPAESSTGSLELIDMNEAWRTRLLRVDVDQTLPIDVEISARWLTDLTVIPRVLPPSTANLSQHAAQVDAEAQLDLTCIDTTDWLGEDDDVRLQMTVDTLPLFDPAPNLGDFDEEETRNLSKRIDSSVGFLDHVDLRLREDDSFLTGADDILRGVSVIGSLSSIEASERFDIDLVGDGGSYRLTGKTFHRSPDGSSLAQNPESPKSWDVRKPEP